MPIKMGFKMAMKTNGSFMRKCQQRFWARLRERRGWFLAAVQAARAPLVAAPSANAAGDCGNSATFLFAGAETRAAVGARTKAIEPACNLSSPIEPSNNLDVTTLRGQAHPARRR